MIASTDVLAIGLLHEAHVRGLSVPGDISITGFDDIPLAAFTVPALTTVRMPTREMVRAAIAMVIDDEMTTLSGELRHPVLQPSLVVRESTRRIDGAAD